jgi:hypothetical protein
MTSSLNVAIQYGAVQNAFQSVSCTRNNMTSASMDIFSTNKAFVKMIEHDQDVIWMLNHCFMHCENNAIAEDGFPALYHVMPLRWKIFCQSEAPHIAFERATHMSCKTFSDNCWGATLRSFMSFTQFFCMTMIMVNIVKKQVSPVNYVKLKM